MMNPLNKRHPRQLVHGVGRHLAIFLLLSVVIGLVSGFLVAASSIEKIYNEMDETYSIEDGRFVVEKKLGSSAVKAVEKKGVQLYENFSHDAEYKAQDGAAVTMRVYKNRTELNRAAVFEGALPSTGEQIALDQTFASKRGLSVGDEIVVSGQNYVISGLVVLSDYSALFKSNSDFMMDTSTFCVAVTTDEGFARLKNVPISYTYSYTFDKEGLSTAERTDVESDIVEALSKKDVDLTELVDAEESQAIGYSGEDVTHDQVIYEVLLVLIIVIMAFIFVIVTNSAIEAESSVIGTLLASGYTNGQLIRHYVFLPTLVGVIACIIGNIAGYGWLSEPMRGLYYNSYSFPPYVASFNARAFVMTTVVPLAMLIGVSFWGIARKLRCTPLQFLRHDTVRRSRRHSVALPARLGYVTRFRLRVFIRNLPQFATLFAGIMFSSLLLVFGLALLPVMENYAGTLAQTMPAEHVYSLKVPYELEMTKSQKKLRNEIKQQRKLKKAVDALRSAGTELDKGSSAISNGLDSASSGSSQLANALSGQFSQGADALSKGSKSYSSALDGLSKGQNASASAINLESEQSAYAVALKKYVQACAASVAKGGDPSTDSTALAAYASLEKSLTTLVEKAAEKGGYAGAAKALQQASASYKKLGAGVDKLSSSTDALGQGASQLDEGLDTLSSGYDEYADGVTSYTGAVSTLLESAQEMLQEESGIEDFAERYHVVAKKGTNSQDAIDSAEKLAVGQLEILRSRSSNYETVTVYGIKKDSRYWSDIDVSDGKVVVGAGLAEKCSAQVGSVSVFHNKFEDENYALSISDTTANRTDTNVYMSLTTFNELFGNDSKYFNGYVSDEELNIDSDYLASHLTPADMEKMGAQMTDSMGEVIKFVVFLAVFVFFIVVYLLTKTTIEHSARSISYMKVFGYRDREINKLYLRSITATVLLSLLLSLPLVTWGVVQLCTIMLVDYSGNFVISVPADVLAMDFAIGVLAYSIIALLHMRHIKKVPLAMALKSTE